MTISSAVGTSALTISAASKATWVCPTREICINEYCRIKGDLGIPGQLIQRITRFENSKVDACLDWTDAGSLNNLVTRDYYNRALARGGCTAGMAA